METLYLSIEDAAKYAGIGRDEFRSMLDRPGAPILRVGRKRYVERAGIAPFLRTFQEGSGR